MCNIFNCIMLGFLIWGGLHAHSLWELRGLLLGWISWVSSSLASNPASRKILKFIPVEEWEQGGVLHAEVTVQRLQSLPVLPIANTVQSSDIYPFLTRMESPCRWQPAIQAGTQKLYQPFLHPCEICFRHRY